MDFVDTHTHLFLPDFHQDLSEVINRAISLGVKKMVLPNIDEETFQPMMELCNKFPANCYPMIGLHPTSVREDFRTQLDNLFNKSELHKFVAIGEVGIDLYWDTKLLHEQQEAFAIQIDIAREASLPLVIHSRQSFDEIMEILKKKQTSQKYCGVFHCFSGTTEQAKSAMDLGFMIGIGGVVTYKNSNLAQVVSDIPLEFIVLETDSPYLTPVPNRGKRNESSYIPLIANKVSELKNISMAKVAEVTTLNALNLFNLD